MKKKFSFHIRPLRAAMLCDKGHLLEDNSRKNMSSVYIVRKNGSPRWRVKEAPAMLFVKCPTRLFHILEQSIYITWIIDNQVCFSVYS